MTIAVTRAKMVVRVVSVIKTRRAMTMVNAKVVRWSRCRLGWLAGEA